MTKKRPTKARPAGASGGAPRAVRSSPKSAVRGANPVVPPPSDNSVPVIVGVGASAGGLEAFGAVLSGISTDANLALVFVQHLAPQHDSALVALLTGQSPFPVVQADRDMRL